MRTILIASLCQLALFVAPLAADIMPASQDVNIANGDLASVNLSGLPQIMINWECDPLLPCTTSQGLVQFDLSSLSGITITSAVLRLWQESNEGPGKIFDLYRNTSLWDENTVTYDTRPSVDPIPVATLALAVDDNAVGLYRQWDVTALMQGWLSGTLDNYGVTLIERDEVPGNWVYFSSRESPGQEPLLDFTEGSAVPEPGTLALFGGALALLGLVRFARRR